MPDSLVRILLIEDSPSDAELLQKTLHRTGAGGFEFTCVERLDEALTRLGQEAFDVLLLDLSLPDSSGLGTLRSAQKAAPRSPIVVLTGIHDESLGLAAVQEGAQDYLVKGECDGRQIARSIRYAIERKHAGEQLREQREWLRVTLTSIGDAVIAADTGGRITFLNPIAESLTGWTADEALGQPIESVFRIINEQTRQPADDLVARVLKENRAITLANQTVLLTGDGREVAIEDSAAPILDAAGRVVGVVLVFRDVTERRRAQAALAAAHVEVVAERNRLQAVMETLPVGVALVDLQGGNIRSNPAFEQVWGGPRPPTHSVADYAAYKAWWLATGQPVQPEEWASARAVQQGETVVGQEMEIQRFDGRRAFVLNSAAPILDAQGRIAGSAVAIMDITERKRAEESLRRLAQFPEENPNPVLRIAVDGMLLYANAPARAMLAAMGGAAAPPPPAAIQVLVARALRENRPVEAELDDGCGRAWWFTATQPAGERYVNLYGQDITQRKRAEAALRESEQTYSAIFDTAPYAMTLTRMPEAILAAVNDAFLKLFEYTREEVIGKTSTELGIADPDSQVQVTEELKTRGVVRDFECVRTTKSGARRILSLNLDWVALGGEKQLLTTIRDITLRRKAEEALRQSEAHFRALTEALPQIVWTAGSEGAVEWFNQRWYDYTGEPRGVGEGWSWEKVAHPDDLAHTRKNWQAALESGALYQSEIRVRRHDGEYRWFLVRAWPLRDAGGTVVRWFGTNTDIQEMKAAEAALRQSQEDLSRAQEVGQIGSWRMDVRRNVLTWSDENHRIFGVPKGTPLTYETFLGTVHPDDREYVDRRWMAGLRGEPYDIEHRIVAGEEVKWVREKAYLEFEDGKLLGGFGITQDITQRKQAEERIRRHNAVLEGINRILSEALAFITEEELGRKCLAVVEQVTLSKFGFIGELDAEGQLHDIAVSDPGWEACRMDDPTGHRKLPVGFKINGLYGRVILDGKGFYTNDPFSHPDSVGTPEGHPPLKSFLGTALKHDGKTIGVLVVANREGGYRPGDLESLEALAAAVVEVLMRKRAEQAVRAGEERLWQAQKMESIGVLAGGIAHDFNNLLTSILGNASLLQMDTGPDGEPQLSAIIEASEKAASLTRQLLAYAGKGQFQISDFDVSRLVRSSADLIRVSISKNIDVRSDVPRKLPAVRGDASQIQQVVMNLVINAAEATEGRADGRVSISAGIRDLDTTTADRLGLGAAPGRYVSITVSDNGCGMDEQTKAKIFDPFFTTKFTGRGLGLAAVQGILRSHKGAITVESSPGQGSTFTVYLPCVEARAASVRRRARPAGKQSATVLVIEDDAVVASFTKAALDRLGYTVLLAENGRQALEVLAGHAGVDLVVLDIVMPVLGGVEAYAEMRKRWPQLVVLVATGYSREEARRLGVPGDLPFIEKPYTVQTLAAAVAKALKAGARRGE